MLTNDCSTEVDRAYENLQKSGKGYGMGGRRKFYGFSQRSCQVSPQVSVSRLGLAGVMSATINPQLFRRWTNTSRLWSPLPFGEQL